MNCPKCRSINVLVQQQTDTRIVNAHHNILWWLAIGWWWIPIKWIFLTIPALIFKIFGHKKQKVKQTHYTVCTCQSCGHSWRI